tara:strand:+ start:76 stop:648 length:573 start_codon:yes stop_codon:yes gene_type:complete
MKTIEPNLYAFNELNQNAKNNAIEKEKNDQEIFLDFFKEDCIFLAAKNGFENIDLQYSLSYCQGDGLSFSSSNYTKLNELFLEVLGKGKEKTANLLAENCETLMKGNTGHYSYAAKNQIDLYLDSSVNDLDNIETIVGKVLLLLESKYIELCGLLEKNGYSEIEYQRSNEAIIESLEANEYQFLVDGSIY